MQVGESFLQITRL